VIEYVRGPMRIAMAPVASANPNDAGTGRPRRGKKIRRWERGGFRSDGPRPDRFGGGAMVRTDGPPRQPPWAQGEGNGAPGERRRRRRRRKRRPGDGPPMQGGDFQGNGAPPPGDAPVGFFAPAGGAPSPIALGPDGQPLRKRRRRRRRGRGGRQREWRTQGQGGDGGNGGGGSAPPSGGGVGSISDGGGGSG
jgi:hypothetical protein